MKKLKVISKPGTQTPKEGRPRSYLSDSAAVDVPDTTYYRRLINDGSLLIHKDKGGKNEYKSRRSPGINKKARKVF